MSPNRPVTKPSKLWSGIFLALISICLTLFALEILVRLLAPPYPVDTGKIFSCDPTLGWTGAPDFQDIFEDDNFRQALSFNALGMHDTDHAWAKPANTFRMLMLGDSFVQAIQVNETETAHQVLEDRLNAASPGQNFEVISSGVVNWGTNQQLVYYREQGRRFEPDLVILMLYLGNDFQDNLPGNVMTIDGFNCYAPYFALCESEFYPTSLTYAPGFSRMGDVCSPLQRWIINGAGQSYQISRLYRQIEPLIVARYPREEFGKDFPLDFAALYLPDEEPALRRAYQLTEATIAQLRQEVEADGARFAVALISPWPVIRLQMLTPAEQAVFLKDNPQFTQAQIDRPNQRMIEFLTAQNIPFIDLTQPMIAYSSARGRVPLYIIGEGHWTAEGNQVAGNLVADWLAREALLAK